MDSVKAKDITREYTASYAKYVATSRAIPSLVDGLKPVNRRCINSADDLKIYHDKKFLKVAKLEGQVMGDYHPHGGASMVILAQPFKTRYPLFEGQGNFGSPDEPNSVAASRYIETRLTKFCEDFYLESAEYADKEDNYDGRLKEIVRYYPPIPGVLLTKASNMAVGLSTNIPPHCISDVCKSMLDYIKNPKSDKYLKDMMPETCEESIILTPKKDILPLYTKGECSIRYKAKTHYETIDGKMALVVDAFPPDYSKKRLETSYILDAVESGALELRNESSTEIRYVFISDSEEVLKAVEERLVSSSGYRMYMEHDGKLKLYRLSEIYDDFITSRKGYIIRKYTDLYQKVLDEDEYLRVWIAFKQDKEYIKTIFDRSNKEVVSDITKKHNTSTEVAKKVLSSSLSSMMRDGDIDRLQKKRVELKALSEEYKSYINDPLIKITLDIKSLYKQYKNEVRRAIHIDDVSDEITIHYKGTTIEATPTSQFFYFDSPTNLDYSVVSALDIAKQGSDVDTVTVVSTEYDYYVMYDEQGLVTFTRETMLKGGNRFKSDHLIGVIGTNDLSKVIFRRSNKNKDEVLGDWSLRTRLSYIRLADGKDSITVKMAQP